MTRPSRDQRPRQPHTVADKTRLAPRKRKRFQDMNAAEFAEWIEARRAGLADFTAYAQSYLDRRLQRPGSEGNPTNQRYQEFLQEAADLLAGLAELRDDAEQAAKDQEGNEL